MHSANQSVRLKCFNFQWEKHMAKIRGLTSRGAKRNLWAEGLSFKLC